MDAQLEKGPREGLLFLPFLFLISEVTAGEHWMSIESCLEIESGSGVKIRDTFSVTSSISTSS